MLDGTADNGLSAWVGRTEVTDDVAAAAPLAGLAALLDHAAPPWLPGELPPLGHWLYFLPRALQRHIAVDGHPQRGGFLPPVPLPRRMWAAGRITFHAPIPIGAAITRQSTVADVRERTGRTGPLCFVTVQHDTLCGTDICISEEQDIVYRGASNPAAAPAAEAAPEPAFSRVVRPDPVMLFRYSALTFNGHRIHYDRAYCQDEEGYPGLVVHGPLIATLLADLFLRHHPGAAVRSFGFRAQQPLFDTGPFTVCGRPTVDGAELWALSSAGAMTMHATLAAT